VKSAIQTAQAIRTGEATAGALLSLPDSLQWATPLRAWKKDQRDWMQSFFSQLASDWHRAWGLSIAPVRQESTDALFSSPSDEVGIAPQHDSPASRAATACAWSFATVPDEAVHWQGALHRGSLTPAQSRAPLAAIHASMFGEEASQPATALLGPGIALELSASAWADWWRRLQDCFAAPSDQTPETSVANPYWSGALQLHLSWCGGVLLLELELEQVTSLLSAHAPDLLRNNPSAAPVTVPKKVSLLNALGVQTLPLRAMLSGVELSLRQIQSLRVGDIVPLQHRLDEPTFVETPDASLVCHGWLGQKSGQVAVEMVSSTTNSKG
jgi:Type III flagellar switch regulator (C-ring) FliN C-term